MQRRQPKTIVKVQGFSAGSLLTAFVVGAAAGAALLYLNGGLADEHRKRVRRLADGARDALGRVPDALKKAGEAARVAFNETIAESADDPATPFTG